ncbi:MAG: hypothetical protein E5X34_22955 [Mesorhizobium sp.]|uniref:hypothetical protein n=1 Tax=Mesorhizobium sp. TaxID=1871066 RepID=UPI001204FEBE|nr:hypothetical protein [Mesorhizobium sp.]TIR17849.1 MAG: hypothetical protein E5X34_22955 [Mesorhizobium sp.]
MGTKRKRSGSLGLTEPFHHNFPEYSDLGAIFTPKMKFGKMITAFADAGWRRTTKSRLRLLAAGPKRLQPVQLRRK